MAIEVVRDALAWCAVINIVLLLWWLLFFSVAHDWTYKFHNKWFDISPERFDFVHYSGMMLFKIGIWIFNLTPYFALRIIG